MRSRFFGVIVVALSVLLSSLGVPTAAAAPPDPDRDVPPGRTYERPTAEW